MGKISQSAKTFNIISVNGIPSSKFSPINLPDGKVLVELQYQDIFSYRADDSGTWVRSEPLYIIIDAGNGTNDNYKIVQPNINSKSEAKKFIKKPIIELNINENKLVSYTLQTHSQLMTRMLKFHHSEL